jgi:hypothetical protein
MITILSLLPAHNLRALLLPTLAIPLLAYLPLHTSGDPWSDYSNGSAIAEWTLAALDYVVLSRPEREFWRVDDGHGGMPKEPCRVVL